MCGSSSCHMDHSWLDVGVHEGLSCPCSHHGHRGRGWCGWAQAAAVHQLDLSALSVVPDLVCLLLSVDDLARGWHRGCRAVPS